MEGTERPVERMQDLRGRIGAGLDAGVGALAFVLLAITVITALAGVVSRYVFNASFTWTEELSVLTFLWLVFLGIAAGYRKGGHLSFSLIGASLSDRGRRILGVGVDVVVAFTTISILIAGYDVVSVIGGVSPALDWPEYLKFVMAPVACGCALIYQAVQGEEQGKSVIRNLAVIVVGVAAVVAISNLPSPIFASVSPALVALIALLASLAAGVPVPFAFLFAVALTAQSTHAIPLPATIPVMVNGVGKFVLLAIPFFLAAGYLMTSGGITDRLIRFAIALVGHMRAGLAQVNVVNSMLVGGISGSSGADVASTTKVLVPEMVKRGYSPGFSCALTAMASIMPNVIPPSIAMLIYASLIPQVSVAKLFVAGIVPGLLIAATLMVANYIVAVRRGFEGGGRRAPLREIVASFFSAAPALMLVVIIVGGMRFGVVTVTEAGALAVLWAIFLGAFVYRAYNLRRFYDDMVACALDVAMIGLLIAATVPIAWVMVAERLPQQAATWVAGLSLDGWILLLIVNAFLLLSGMILETMVGILVFAPLLLPLSNALGLDPHHFAIVVIVNLMIGAVTPPVGMLVYVSTSIAGIAPRTAFAEMTPFLIASGLALLVLTYFPVVSLGLWRLLS